MDPESVRPARPHRASQLSDTRENRRMRFDEVPRRPAVGERPRDARGYPVPAITPWENGEPRFALNDYGRARTCALERLCSVCGKSMPEGPVWRVVGQAG